MGKDASRVDAYGTVDELNALLGVVRASGVDAATDDWLGRFQVDLFVLGAELATSPGKAGSKGRGVDRIVNEDVAELERIIDQVQEGLPPLTHFILPGGSPAGAALHHARVVCRRAERRAVALAREEPVRPEAIRYLNRLSDLLFVLARRVNQAQRRPEVAWLHAR